MIYTLIIKEEAYLDIQEAYNYYEAIQQNLGNKFIKVLKEKIDYIQIYPLHFRKIEEEFRQVLIDTFPYQIIYEVEENLVLIYSVFNAYKNPEKKLPK